MSETHAGPDTGNISKPDIAANALYPVLARATLAELHANLLDLLGQGLSSRKGPKTLVVVGPGSEVLPFSENLEALASLLDGGNLVLLDYNREICDGIAAYLEGKGFARRFSIERSTGEDIIEPGNLRDTIIVRQWNIRNGFPLPVSSADAIDMTVSMHHVTQYETDIADLFKHVRNTLRTGGVLHLGEGDVDMKYSERKLKRLAHDVLAAGARGVRVSDSRYMDAAPRQWQVGEEDADASIHVSSNGMLSIGHAEVAKVSTHLGKSGYKQMYLTDQAIVLPLIDHAMEEDFQEMVVPIRAFYDAITGLGLRRLDPAYREAFVTALSKERSDALRGIVEYYSLCSTVCDALGKTGFRVDEVRHTPNSPFVNILAVSA